MFLQRFLVPLVIAACVAFAAGAEPVGLPKQHSYGAALYSSAQPTAQQLQGLARSGLDVVVNLSPTPEPWSVADEGNLVAEAGLDYVHISVDWLAPTQQNVDAFFAAMDGLQGKSVLVHCSHNARASAFLYLYRVAALGADADLERTRLDQIWAKTEGLSLQGTPEWAAFLEQSLEARK